MSLKKYGDRLLVCLVIEGPPRTKKTHQQIAKRRDGTPFVVSAETTKKWSEVAAIQLKAQWGYQAPIAGPVNVKALIYRDVNTGDAAAFYQAIGDVLEQPSSRASKSTKRKKAGVLVNDRQIESWDGSRRLIDRERPRIELEIELL